MNISRIAEERKKLGLSQEELANRLNISQKSISKYERGTRRPSYETLLGMSTIFGVSVDYLLGNDTPSDSVSEPQLQLGGYDNSLQYWIGKTGMSYGEVALSLKITEDTLQDYIENRTAIPYSILELLAEICEVSTDCLLGLATESRERDFDNILPFKYDYNIAKRIRNLCDSKAGTTSSFLGNLLSLSQKEVYYLIEYGFIPHVDTFLKLSAYFNVSTDYLLCKNDMQDEKMLSTFKQLNDDNKDIVIGETKKALRDQRYEESVATKEPLKKTGTDNKGK